MQSSASSGPTPTMPAAGPDGEETAEARMPELSDHDQTRLAIAALFAALIRSLHDQGTCDLERFDKEIERLHFEMGEEKSPPLMARRTLRWTHKYLRQGELE